MQFVRLQCRGKPAKSFYIATRLWKITIFDNTSISIKLTLSCSTLYLYLYSVLAACHASDFWSWEVAVSGHWSSISDCLSLRPRTLILFYLFYIFFRNYFLNAYSFVRNVCYLLMIKLFQALRCATLQLLLNGERVFHSRE